MVALKSWYDVTEVKSADDHPRLLSLAEDEGLIHDRWVFTLDAAHEQRRDVESYVEYEYTIKYMSGSGVLEGEFVWTLNSDVIHRSDHTHVIAKRTVQSDERPLEQSVKGRFGPVEDFQTLQVSVDPDDSAEIIIDVYWKLVMDEIGRGQISLTALDAKFDPGGRGPLVCTSRACLGLLGGGILVGVGVLSVVLVRSRRVAG